MNKSKKTALITGASSGIGKSYTERFAEMGYDLIIVSRRAEELRKYKCELENRFDITVETKAADLANALMVDELCREVEKDSSIEILVNNAGFGTSKHFAEKDISNEVKMIEVHNTATIKLTHAVLPNMIRGKRGYIVNVSSIAAFTAVAGNTTYSATKAFLNGFSQALQKEVAQHNIKIQALCPGFTYTGFHDTEEYKDFSRANTPQFLWMNSDRVVDISIRKLESNRVVIIPGFVNRLTVFISRFPLLMKIAKAVLSKR